MRLTHVFAARQRIAPYIRHTPLVHSPWLSSQSGATVRLKLESLQVTNSFKARGAVNVAAARLEREAGDVGRSRFLVTASAGNHGRAMAYACERLGLRLVVFTPKHAPRAKLDPISAHGADLRAVASNYEEAELLAKQFAAAERITYISPYSHPDVIAGAATIGIEILEDWPEVETIMAPVGGGGLVSGIALAIKAASARVQVIGVEAEASPAFSTSLAAGRITEVTVKPTIADGLAGNMDPDSVTFDLVQRYVDRVVVAPERAIEEAVRGLMTHEHLVAEGAGAAAVAALAEGFQVTGRKVAVVLSGANIDSARLGALLMDRLE
ncbi:MAG: threonine/serine dehydratase [Acidobacteria bacterium]|nr:threonine/serine dehydratase [Acidobacteriota bacterium]